MNFKKLPKEKRDQLVLVVLITVVALIGLGFGLIRFQYESLKRTRVAQEKAVLKLDRMKQLMNRADQMEAELTTLSAKLKEMEKDLATSGDVYAWALDLVRRFRLSYRVEVPGVSQPAKEPASLAFALLPKFPYEQQYFTVTGSGYYHDIGKFVADFENQFPYFRLINLTLTPLSSLSNEEKEKLEFRMEVMVLVRPNAA